VFSRKGKAVTIDKSERDDTYRLRVEHNKVEIGVGQVVSRRIRAEAGDARARPNAATKRGDACNQRLARRRLRFRWRHPGAEIDDLFVQLKFN
jgi:hypothetical protein